MRFCCHGCTRGRGLWGKHLANKNVLQEELFIKFAEFEEKVGEDARARAIYKYALDHIPRSQADNVYKRFVAFEKQHGDRDGIEVGQKPSCRSTLSIVRCMTAGATWR